MTNREWITANGAAYRGQWVCLKGGELIAAGAGAKEVFSKAISGCVVEFVADEQAPFAGW